MAYQQKQNTGSLFKNEHKTADNHPEYRGKALVNGWECDISAWIKTDKEGKRFMSLSFAEPWKKTGETKKPNHVDDDDDLPF